MSQQNHDARLFAKEITKYLDDSQVGKRITPKVSALFSKLTKTVGGANISTVESAVPLTQPEKRAIEKHLKGTAEYRVNQELLTGVKIRVGDLLIDMSGQIALHNFVAALSS